jgi:cytochrome c peroxidase
MSWGACALSLGLSFGCAPPEPPPARKSSGSSSATTGASAPKEEAKPAEEKPAEEKPTEEKPADEKPAAEDKPAAEKPADEKPADEKPADEKPAAEKPADEPAKPEAAKPEAEPAKPAPEKPAEDKPAEAKPAEATPAAEKPAEEKPAGAAVKLGSGDLTAGIPGDGALSVEAIQKWLDEPKNHEVLAVQLPEGLAAGVALLNIPQDNPMTRAKIELGRQLYFDTRLSSDNTVSCASCHHPDNGYARDTQFGVGVKGQMGGRNSPTSFNRILSGAQFWDGRAASLEAQAVGPIANPIEMGNTHEKCVDALKGIEGYKLQFEKVFPGEGVTIGNVGKAIAAFERSIVTGPSAYEFYEPLRVFEAANKEDLADLEALKKEDPELFAKYETLKKASDAKPMSVEARRGRDLFFSEKANCTACHVGANFSDEKYHNIGVGMDKEKPDLGRFEVTKDEKDKGAFKTPTLRNISQTGPYMHDGSQKTLEEVVEWYAKGGHPNPHLSDKMKKLELSDQDKKDLVAFMMSLTGDLPVVRADRLP